LPLRFRHVAAQRRDRLRVTRPRTLGNRTSQHSIQIHQLSHPRLIVCSHSTVPTLSSRNFKVKRTKGTPFLVIEANPVGEAEPPHPSAL